MIPSFRPGIRSSNRIRAVASADVTPTLTGTDGTVWCDTLYRGQYIEDCFEYYTNARFTNIDTTITIRVEYLNVNIQLYYKKNHSTVMPYTSGGNFCGDTIDQRYYASGSYNYSTNGWTAVNNNDTLTISNNDYLAFGATLKAGSGYQSEAVTLKNVSDGNAIVGTFNAIYGNYC
jgi:hypothetical protein